MPAKTLLPLFGIMALFGAAPGFAEDRPATTDTPERISFLAPIGDEKCPEATGDEIVVCAPISEGDRYRIPRRLRKKPIEDMAGGSWTSAVENLDEYARLGRPNSCSVVGSNGFTGCTQKMIRDWYAERRDKAPPAKVKTGKMPDLIFDDGEDSDPATTETDAGAGTEAGSGTGADDGGD